MIEIKKLITYFIFIVGSTNGFLFSMNKCESEKIFDNTKLPMSLQRIIDEYLEDDYITLMTLKTNKSLRSRLIPFVSLCFSPDESLIAEKLSDGTVLAWNTSNGKLHTSFKTTRQFTPKISFSPDGNYIIEQISNQIKLWEKNTGKIKQEIDCMAGITDYACSTDTKYIATSCSKNNMIQISQLNSKNTRMLPGHNDKVCTLAFNKAGNFLATASYDGQIKLWDLQQNACIKTFTIPDFTRFMLFSAIAFSPDGQQLAVTNGREKIDIFDINSGNVIKRWNDLKDADRGFIKSLSFDSTGQKIFFESNAGLKCLNLNLNSITKLFESKGISIGALAISSDRKYIAYGTNDEIKVFANLRSSLSLSAEINQNQKTAISSSMFRDRTFFIGAFLVLCAIIPHNTMQIITVGQASLLLLANPVELSSAERLLATVFYLSAFYWTNFK